MIRILLKFFPSFTLLRFLMYVTAGLELNVQPCAQYLEEPHKKYLEELAKTDLEELHNGRTFQNKYLKYLKKQHKKGLSSYTIKIFERAAQRIYLRSWTKNDLGAAQKNLAEDHKNICRNFTKYLEEVRKKRGWKPPQSTIFGFATLPPCLSNLSFYNQSRPQNVRKLQFIMT